MKGWTAEELAEMAAADAEIEAGFRWTNEELRAARERDAEAILERADGKTRRIAEKQRAYREANKDSIAEYQRAYREANKDSLAEYKRAYYEANKASIAEKQRAIKDARRLRGYTQQGLAKLLGVSQPIISLWENGLVPADWARLYTVLPELEGMR